MGTNRAVSVVQKLLGDARPGDGSCERSTPILFADSEGDGTGMVSQTLQETGASRKVAVMEREGISDGKSLSVGSVPSWAQYNIELENIFGLFGCSSLVQALDEGVDVDIQEAGRYAGVTNKCLLFEINRRLKFRMRKILSKKVENPFFVDAHVQASPRLVQVSYRSLLNRVLRRFNLGLLDYDYVDVQDNLIQAWIDVEVFADGAVPRKKVEKFIGYPARCRYDTMESASKIGLDYFRRYCDVTIVDANYGGLKRMEYEAIFERQCSSYMNVLVKQERQLQKLRNDYRAVCHRGNQLCKDFMDILSVKLEMPFAGSVIVEDGHVVYTGPKEPVSRFDQFSFALASFVNNLTGVCQASSGTV